MAFSRIFRRLPAGGDSSVLSDCLQLLRPRVTGLSLFTAAAGYLLAATGEVDLLRLLGTVSFTFLASGGGSALNQFLDRYSDSLMSRTAHRPLPARRRSPATVLTVGVFLSVSGMTSLCLWISPLAAALAGLTLLIYVGVYTPLKRKTVLSTWIGAVAGALPPLIGWTAAGGVLDIRALSLWGILFFWQVPHVLAVAWMRRRDYLQAGLRPLSTLDPTGTRTGRQVLLHSGLLLAASLVPFWSGLSGSLYLLAAALLGLALVACSFFFLHSPGEGRARLMLKAGLVYLPFLLIIMILDRL